jgi:hypothetical protein
VPGRYTVRASVGEQRLGDPDPPARELEIGEMVVDVGAIDATGITIALAKAVTIRGTVRFEGASAPPARPRITVGTFAESPLVLLSHRPTGQVKDDLTFELTGLYRKAVTLMIQGLPEGWALKSVRYDGRDITYLPTDLAAAQPGRLEVVVTSDVARPLARVTNDRGEERLDAMIVVLSADPARWPLQFMGMPSRQADGTVTLGTLLPGEYLVAALSVEDYQMVVRDRSRFAAVAPVATKVTFENGDRRTLALRVVPLPAK